MTPRNLKKYCFSIGFSRFLRNPASRLGTSKSTPKYLQNETQKWPRDPPEGPKQASKTMFDFSLFFNAFLIDFGPPNGTLKSSPNVSKIRLGRRTPEAAQRLPGSYFEAARRPPGNHFGAVWGPLSNNFRDMLGHFRPKLPASPAAPATIAALVFRVDGCPR